MGLWAIFVPGYRMPLDAYREQIDLIDQQLVELFNKRAQAAREIGRIKQESGGHVYVPAREEAVYRHLVESNPGPLPDSSLRNIYREIFSACRSLENKQVICYLGPPGSFTEEAARRQFGSSVEYVPVPNIGAVFTEVAARRANHGVVPIENSTVGGIADTLDRFARTDVNICGEVLLAVHLCLMAKCNIDQITHIYSKPEALAQCQTWLARNLPRAKQCEAESTSQAAELVKHQPGASAIAHHGAAAIYDLAVLVESIEDNPENATKFHVLGHGFGGSTGDDRTSLMISIKHHAGSLYDALMPFRKHKVNLTKIESRPSRLRKWEYFFFIDLDGHSEDENVQRAIEELKETTLVMQILGSYPKALEQY